MKWHLVAIPIILALVASASAQEEHHHPVPEHLGTAHLRTSCLQAVAPAFDRAVALLHSFTYDQADMGFADVANHDPKCAMAHWGRAMTHYHQLWDVPIGAGLAAGIAEIDQAKAMAPGTPRERALIAALGAYYANAGQVPAATRALRYSDAMAEVAREFPDDDEIAIFYALSLIATAPSTDRTHARQKRAADILEPIWIRQPDHPGVPHYLIHAYDSAELAQRGLPAARLYAKIAPSAPHALHMPSHIFTRLGLWDDSIASNIAARDAALAQGDVGEALHAMDYLTYAYPWRRCGPAVSSRPPVSRAFHQTDHGWKAAAPGWRRGRSGCRRTVGSCLAQSRLIGSLRRPRDPGSGGRVSRPAGVAGRGGA